MLQRAELTQYAAAFEDKGWDSVTHLLKIKEEQLAVLIKDVQMKSGHALRLRLRQALNLPPPPIGGPAVPLAADAPPPPPPPPAAPPPPAVRQQHRHRPQLRMCLSTMSYSSTSTI